MIDELDSEASDDDVDLDVDMGSEVGYSNTGGATGGIGGAGGRGGAGGASRSHRAAIDMSDEDDEDDFDTSRAVSPSKQTARQRAKGNKDLQETLLTLPDGKSFY